MRMLTHGDIVGVARYLLSIPAGLRPEITAGLIAKAHCADKFRKKYKRGHPFWGDGTLRGALPSQPLSPEPTLSDTEYCLNMSMVFEAVLQWRAHGKGT